MSKSLPDYFSRYVKLIKYLKLGYQYLVNNFLTCLLIPIMGTVFFELLHLSPDELLKLWKLLLHQDNTVPILCSIFLTIIISIVYFMRIPRTIYLIDYTLHQYELNYIEAQGKMKKGDRVWQIAFGSGFKCNSAVWKCNRTIKTPSDGPWLNCIHKYPAHIPEVVNL